MFRQLSVMAGLALAIVLGLAQPAAAQVTISSNATGDAASFNDSFPMPGEVVRPPYLGNLSQYSVWIQRGSATLFVRPVIYEWDNLAPTGAPVWTGPVTEITSPTFTETFFTPNVFLDPTKNYWLAVAQVNPGEFGLLDAGIADNDPNGYYAYRRAATADWGRSLGGELHFSAVFDAPPGPSPIPTLSEWAMILFALALAGGAAWRLQRRSRAAA
ncbi:MAG TPA: IPTL-CTERM sorting domain-containing protein [Brevundimonas sp.]|uniref:IPTL-CTERM sorting domain-containing protein n=1 Tax=Brevundimonas sp. TaxID=1871086 RepID=UPI00263909C5|nr:IPTL-CTERM sorting domain-containing protein [Brevundimonas sp.]HRO33355.1 IPTL-CTERM sorting domain-containing protein [Brevundimonas sp.]